MPKNKAKWEEVKHYNFENVFGFHYLDTTVQVRDILLRLDNVSRELI